jgi:hypothetical protein
MAMIDGCDAVFYANGWDTDTMPEACASADDAACSGVDLTAVADFNGIYDACDYSYNCAETVDFDAVIRDTVPPVIGCMEDSTGGCWWNDEVEKCTYFDIPELSAEDDVNGAYTPGYSVTFGGDVASCGSSSSGQYCTGGEEVSEVDVDEPGTYCIQYDVYDESKNKAIPETFIAVVADTTTPGLYFETSATEIECAEETSNPCPGASSDNVPCTDEPAIEYDDSSINLNAVGSWDITYSTHDGYNSNELTFTVTSVDTTDPTITCPNDWTYEYGDVFNEGSSTVDDTCSEIKTSDDQRTVVPIDDAGDVSELGTYTPTFMVVDAEDNSASCTQTIVIEDTTPPVCEFVGDEYVTVEACTGEYTEDGVTCSDDYDADVNDEVWCEGDCGAVDIGAVGTYTITYGVTDVNGNSAPVLTRYVTVEDTTDPVVTLDSSANVVLEASNPSGTTYSLGATCTDTCPQDGECDGSDIYDQDLTFGVSVVAYASHTEYSSDWEAFDGGSWYECTADGCDLVDDDLTNLVVDDQQYYCGSSDTEDMDTARDNVEAMLPTNGDTTVSDYLQGLSDACGLYVVDYSCTDAVGNTDTDTQYVFTMDTVDPEILESSEEEASVYFSAMSSVAGNGGAVFGVAVVAGVAVGAFQQSRRRTAYSNSPL